MRNLGQPFNRMPENRDREFAELEQRLANQDKNPPKIEIPQKNPRQFSTPKNPRDYITVNMFGLYGRPPVLISKYELPDSNNKTYDEAHEFLFDQGLYMPTPAIFMMHFREITHAHEGYMGIKLKDGNGKEIEGEELEDIYKHRTTNHNNQFESQSRGTNTWLNARFIQGTGINNLAMEKTKQNLGMTVNFIEPLEEYLNKDGYVRLATNHQGLSTHEYPFQVSEPGRNMYFITPQAEFATTFESNYNQSIMCLRTRPEFKSPSLGSFGCFEPENKTQRGTK